MRSGWRARSPCFSAFGGRDTLYSAFNVGRGTRVWVDGESHSPHATAAWSNLLEMDQQPVAALHAGVTVRERASEVRAVLTHDTAFQGGACVAVQVRVSIDVVLHVALRLAAQCSQCALAWLRYRAQCTAETACT